MDTTKPIKKVMYGNTEVPLKTLNLQKKEVEPQTTAQVITPDEAYGGLSEVDIAAVTSEIDANIVAGNIKSGVTILGVEGSLIPDKPDQEKTVTPTEQTQEITGDAGYELAKVTVNPIPSNYKNTNNATATTNDILAGKVAVNSSGDVTGNIQTYAGSKTITASDVAQTVETNNKYLDGNLTVNPTPTEEKTPTIDFSNVTEVEVTPTSGKFLSKVTVERPEDLVAANIRVGKTVYGIEGNLQPDKPDQSKTVTPSTTAQVVEPDTGYELASVTVEAIQTEQKTVKSTDTSQTITPTQGKFIDEVTVDPVVLQDKEVTLTSEQQIIEPDQNYDGLSSVTVPALNLQEKTAEANSIRATVVEPDEGYDGLSSVTIRAARLQNRTVTPTTQEQVIEKQGSLYYGLGRVTVAAVDPDDYTDPYNSQLIDLNSGRGAVVAYEDNSTGTTVEVVVNYTTEPNATGDTAIIE